MDFQVLFCLNLGNPLIFLPKKYPILMKCILTFLFALLWLVNSLSAQNCDDPDRYLVPVGSTVERLQIDFATVQDYTNQTRILRAHVYSMPDDTVSNRPLVILAHGGAFLFGSKNDMRAQCESFARLGYVCAAIDYRLYPILLGLPDSAKVVEIAFNAISDMRAAVRHFKANADRENTFRINPDKITAGGLSAGAIMALHVGVLDENDPLTPEFETFLSTRGGVEGNVGDSINRSYDSRVSAVLNLSGALFSLDWLDEGDPMILSMHGDADDVVPYATAREGAFNRVTCNGSSVIHERAVSLGLDSYFMGVPGGGHTDIYGAGFTAFYTEFQEESQRRMRLDICDEPSSADAFPVAHTIDVYPNPSDHEVGVYFDSPLNGRYDLIDMHGKSVYSGDLSLTESFRLSKGALSPGVYTLVVHTKEGGRLVHRISFH
jgi:para-nitrobenzyl esterase